MEALLSFHVKDIGVEGLSKISLPADDHLSAFKNLLKQVGAIEGFYLATCNRVEFLFHFSGEPRLSDFKFHGLTPRVFWERGEILRHLLEVTLSKDSVIFGENQILGQFKRAYEHGLRAKVLGPHLSPMLNAVIRDAKAIRTRVGLSQCHTSVSTVAGHKILKTFEPKKILFVGAGETNTLLTRYLSKRIKPQLFWTSRTIERATKAAQGCGGETIEWSGFLNSKLPEVDVICVATHSQEILVNAKTLDVCRPRLVCDLAVPPNASKDDCDEREVLYYGIDELNRELEASQMVSKSLIDKLEEEIRASYSKILAELEERAHRKLAYANFESRDAR